MDKVTKILICAYILNTIILIFVIMFRRDCGKINENFNKKIKNNYSFAGGKIKEKENFGADTDSDGNGLKEVERRTQEVDSKLNENFLIDRNKKNYHFMLSDNDGNLVTSEINIKNLVDALDAKADKMDVPKFSLHDKTVKIVNTINPYKEDDENVFRYETGNEGVSIEYKGETFLRGGVELLNSALEIQDVDSNGATKDTFSPPVLKIQGDLVTNLKITKNLEVDGNTTLNTDLKVINNTILEGDLQVTGKNVKIGKELAKNPGEASGIQIYGNNIDLLQPIGPTGTPYVPNNTETINFGKHQNLIIKNKYMEIGDKTNNARLNKDRSQINLYGNSNFKVPEGLPSGAEDSTVIFANNVQARSKQALYAEGTFSATGCIKGNVVSYLHPIAIQNGCLREASILRRDHNDNKVTMDSFNPGSIKVNNRTGTTGSCERTWRIIKDINPDNGSQDALIPGWSRPVSDGGIISKEGDEQSGFDGRCTAYKKPRPDMLNIKPSSSNQKEWDKALGRFNAKVEAAGDENPGVEAGLFD